MDSAESELLEEEELPEIKYIDSAEFQNFDNNADQREIQFRWMEAFETKGNFFPKKYFSTKFFCRTKMV